MLSEVASHWILDVLGIDDKQREYRKVEHDCLDDLERRKIIRQ